MNTPRLACLAGVALLASLAAQTPAPTQQLSVSASRSDGSYSIGVTGAVPIVSGLSSAEIDGRWLRADAYPRHEVSEGQFSDELGAGRQWMVTASGLSGSPDLVTTLHVYDEHPYGNVEVTLRNSTGKEVSVQAIRSFEAAGRPAVNLGAADSADRILSDSYSEDRPEMRLFDLSDQPMHRAVGSQLIFNRQSGQFFFWGALTSRRFLTILHLAQSAGQITSYTLDSTGTTEIQRGESLKDAPAANQIDLSLPLAAGESMRSERTLFATGRDYHALLEVYGQAIRVLHNARVTAPTPIGWWSWTAFYAGLTDATARTNIDYLAEHLKPLGYTYFHIDEGYEYARGEYATPNATLFPHGMKRLGEAITQHGLTFGIWTAPFEATNRSWVFEHHRDWLVHNQAGEPIQIGRMGEHGDLLYALDTTNPGAQDYLRQTYRTLVNDWGVRYIKMDFMDDSAIEGYYYRPHTTALEAQQVGLEIIRQTVGDGVLLDKDGSPMLNPVGYVDSGRISLDTGHSFIATKEAAPGIAARYYMNRNWFISDPDAFTVAAQLLPEQRWHQSATPLTLEEARASIALDAVSGGMYEIGDDLPTLGADAERVALLKNRDLLDMARLGRAAVPVDLMTYVPEDLQPSLFVLKEDPHQAFVTVFNWTEQPRSHTLRLAGLGLAGGQYQASEILANAPVTLSAETLALADQPPHSARVIKLINSAVAATPPQVTAHVPSSSTVGDTLRFAAHAQRGSAVPAIGYHWDFGDGTAVDGPVVEHAYTRDGTFRVQLTVDGVDGMPAQQTFQVTTTGYLHTLFHHEQNRRYVETR